MNRQVQAPSVLARFALLQLTERQQKFCKLRRRELRKCISLILGVRAAEEMGAVAFVTQPRIVTGASKRSAYWRSVPSLTWLLHETHGLGVFPDA